MPFTNVWIEKFGPITTNVAEYLLPRVGPTYPQIYITIRYKIHPKTGLFIYKTEDDIKCFFSPNGWDSTGDFSAPSQNLEQYISFDQKTLHFKIRVTVRLGDAKATTGFKEFFSAEFSAPHQTASIKIKGTMNTRGHIEATSTKA